jgi:hypothetical protein
MLPARLVPIFVFAVLLAESATVLAKDPAQYSWLWTQSVHREPSIPPVPPASCPITKPPSEPFVPPAPYPTKVPSDSFWIGSEKLWTSRSKTGLWHGYWTTDGDLEKHKIYFDKVFWWRKGYDWRTENPPQLKVSGRRLDAPAAPFYVDHANPANIKIPAMLTGIDIPTVGCWEITGDYKGDKLAFVVWVVDPPSNVP